MPLCNLSNKEIKKKKHFSTFDFFVKMKLVSSVHKSMSISKSGYCPGEMDMHSVLAPVLFNKHLFIDVC